MTNPTIRIHDLSTNEVIDREMTDDEFAAYQAQQDLDAIQAQQDLEAISAKEAAQAKLAALGLTADDLKALGL
jgi:hypothetical protein